MVTTPDKRSLSGSTRNGWIQRRLYLTFRTLFRSSGVILAEPPAERSGRSLHGLFHTR